jgi:hypothetical protein
VSSYSELRDDMTELFSICGLVSSPIPPGNRIQVPVTLMNPVSFQDRHGIRDKWSFGYRDAVVL